MDDDDILVSGKDGMDVNKAQAEMDKKNNFWGRKDGPKSQSSDVTWDRAKVHQLAQEALFHRTCDEIDHMSELRVIGLATRKDGQKDGFKDN